MTRIKFDENLESNSEARKEYYADKSLQAKDQADQTWDYARKMASCIPFGQPILVGHHSERGDRRFRARIEGNFRKASLLMDKSSYYFKRSQANSNAIHSLDKNADDKIQAKIDKLIKRVELSKLANKVILKNKTIDSLINWVNENPDNLIIDYIRPQIERNEKYGHRIYTYSTTNDNAEIRRLKMRLIIIKEQDERPLFSVIGDTFKAIEEDGRVNVYFDDKPSEELRTKLKRLSMKWSPTRSAWTRQITTSTRRHFFTDLKNLLSEVENAS